MKGKISKLPVVIAAVLVLTSSVLLAQKAGQHRASTALVQSDFNDMWGGGAWMGVRLGDISAEKARELKLSGDSGALVKKVEADGPASKAGLQANDVITEFDGERVRSVAELRRLIRETPPGRKVDVKVNRGGATHDLSITLEPRHDVLGLRTIQPEVIVPHVNIPNFDFNFSLGQGRLGISAQQLTPQLADYFGVKDHKGVLVTEVRPGTPAEKAALKAGDSIVKIDGKDVSTVWDLQSAINEGFWQKDEAKREHTLTIVRDHHEQTIKVEIEAHHAPDHSESAEIGAPEPPEPPEGPEVLAPELEALDDEIAELRAQAPDIKLQADRMRQQLETYQAAFTDAQRAELQKLANRLKEQVRVQISDQQRRQLEEMKRQILNETKELRDNQRNYLDQYKQLLKQLTTARDAV